mmetsp:Transcript_25738/g.70898  ORF Transcript_25738/g.70898 Transcript_25738/m.70898 type:complete len:135 (+) Transcript_25738:361-765(+)|eukprot:scaffold297553_cov39-Tisochrysis_lutea.AAC.1
MQKAEGDYRLSTSPETGGGLLRDHKGAEHRNRTGNSACHTETPTYYLCDLFGWPAVAPRSFSSSSLRAEANADARDARSDALLPGPSPPNAPRPLVSAVSDDLSRIDAEAVHDTCSRAFCIRRFISRPSTSGAC